MRGRRCVLAGSLLAAHGLAVAAALTPGPLAAQPGAAGAGDGATIEAWIDQLAGSYAQSTAATEALERLGPPAVPALIARLGTAGDDLRWGLVNVLGILRAPEALKPLVEAAVLHGEVHARWRGYWAIAAVDDGRAVSLLIPYLDHPDPEVRWRAAVGLAFLGHPSAVPALEAGLAAEEEWRRWEAVNGLASVQGSDSWRKVARLAVGDAEPSVRQEAVMTLWKLGEPRAREALVAAAEDPSAHVRWRALAALAEVVSDLAPWAEQRAAADPDPIVQETFER